MRPMTWRAITGGPHHLLEAVGEGHHGRGVGGRLLLQVVRRRVAHVPPRHALHVPRRQGPPLENTHSN